jgi:ABC-type transport system substrate-binding protein
MANSYPYGSNVRFFVVFRSAATNALVDPTTVRFKIQTPETRAITTWVFGGAGSIVNDSVGNYHADYTCDYPGDWHYRWEADGSYIGGKDGKVCIMESPFA